ncbi:MULTISPECIES: class I SAM-dependent methyltransferase [Gammaproteobacteria]|uniref:Class I SAM-dependent methyltransferase n=1 Tax=Stenotrophomonas lactitubi TaxID=2045214 RepID=A0AAW4GCS6_9GAMM|nr:MULTISPECIES: class I SAM-dependent methyltransferase [Gammaproteobacteria]MBM9912248.1 class I SAM-dependent methyltransferase [Stenotrophomonas lactitubi]MBM9920714.1 class I SAM-dependent methyltransferase [Stenotrophomonas lactitubi]MBM9937844.1 class I SAM-dependent methyltransferase [Stenotrophomonas lactitubi]GBC57231.1 SAM-dependent methyltransferase [Stutzerimonas stutzeri]
MMIQDRLFPATGMPDRNWWHALWPDPDGVIKVLDIKPGMTVVDLGCGYGYFTAAIARRVEPGRVVGFDLDPEMLEQAQAACEGMANCNWLPGDAMELSRLLGAPADYVLIANTFHGVPDKTALAREVAMALKPGGRFAVVNWHPLPREETTVLDQPRGPSTELRMSPEQTRAVVEPAGFTLETLIELPPYHYGAIFVHAN